MLAKVHLNARKKRFIPAEEGEDELFLWNIGQLAHYFEVSERTVRRWVAGGLERRPDGRFDARNAIYQVHCKILLGEF